MEVLGNYNEADLSLVSNVFGWYFHARAAIFPYYAWNGDREVARRAVQRICLVWHLDSIARLRSPGCAIHAVPIFCGPADQASWPSAMEALAPDGTYESLSANRRLPARPGNATRVAEILNIQERNPQALLNFFNRNLRNTDNHLSRRNVFAATAPCGLYNMIHGDDPRCWKLWNAGFLYPLLVQWRPDIVRLREVSPRIWQAAERLYLSGLSRCLHFWDEDGGILDLRFHYDHLSEVDRWRERNGKAEHEIGFPELRGSRLLNPSDGLAWARPPQGS